MSENKQQIKCNLSTGGNTQYEAEKIDDLQEHYLKGFSLLFNTPTDYFNERLGKYVKATIAPNALDNIDLDNSRIFCLYQHDWTKPLGVTRKNLELKLEKPTADFVGGLFYKVKLTNDPLLDKHVASQVQNGRVADCSFAAVVEFEEHENGDITFTNFVELEEVSIVTRGKFAEPSVIVAQKQDVKPVIMEVKQKDGNLKFNKLLKEIKEI